MLNTANTYYGMEFVGANDGHEVKFRVPFEALR